MKLILAALLLCVTAKSGMAQQAQPQTASRLFHACKVFIGMMDAPPGSHPDDLDQEYCQGYFKGFLDGIDLSPTSSSICLADARMGTIIRVYVAYMEKNPKLLDSPEYSGVAFALKDAYACPAKGN